MDTKKILLIGPYKNSELRIGQYFSPPNGIYRIKSFIEQNSDYAVDVIDVDLEGMYHFTKTIKNNNYAIIGFSLLQPTIKNDLQLIKKAKQLSPNSLFIAGGQGAVFNHAFLFNKTQIKVIVKGFGEFTLLEILKHINKLENINLSKHLNELKNIQGLYIKDKKSTIDTGHLTQYSFEQFKDISLSFDFNCIPYEKYWEYMERHYTEEHLKIMKNENFIRTIRIITSSHCGRKCTFCSSTNFLDNACKFQKRVSLEAEDIHFMVKKALKAHPGCKAIYFNDDDFLFDKQRAIKLCNLLQKEQNLSYFCLSRIDNLDDELLIKLKETGFSFIIFGIESFSSKVLKDMNKNILTDDVEKTSIEAIKKTIDLGITPLMNLILFYPTADKEDIIKSIECTIPLVNYGARLTVYPYIEAYPGSHIFNDKKQKIKYESFRLGYKRITLPKLLIPLSKDIQLLAKKSTKLSKKLLDQTLKKYNWQGVVPHPLYGLTLFLAVYQILEKDFSNIENTIHNIMTYNHLINENQQGILKVSVGG